MTRKYIGHAWFAPPMVQPARPIERFRPDAKGYAEWRRYLVGRTAVIRWDIRMGVNPMGTMLRDTQAAMHNLRLARSESRTSSRNNDAQTGEEV